MPKTETKEKNSILGNKIILFAFLLLPVIGYAILQGVGAIQCASRERGEIHMNGFSVSCFQDYSDYNPGITVIQVE